MVFMCGDQRKKGSHGFSVRSLGKAFNQESKQSATYFVGSSSAFVGAAALEEAGPEPAPEPKAEPEGNASTAGVPEAIDTKYGIK